MKNPLSILSTAFVLLLSSISVSYSFMYTVTQLTNNTSWDSQARINSNGEVIWSEASENIYLYDGSQVIALTQDAWPIWNSQPCISENGHLSWAYDDDALTNSRKIYYYNGTTTTVISDTGFLVARPAINNNSVIWSGRTGGTNSTAEIWLYNGASTARLTNNTYWDDYPQINQNGEAVWEGDVTFASKEIFFFDGSSVTRLSNNQLNDSSAQINDNGYVVWQRQNITNFQSDYNIYLYDGSTTKKISTLSDDDKFPRINSSGHVVWHGYDGSDNEIFFYDGTSVTQVTDNSYEDLYPDINDRGYIAWKGHDGNDYEIYFNDGSTTIQLTDNSYNDGYDSDTVTVEVNANGDVVWSGGDGGDYEIFIATSPPSVISTNPANNATGTAVDSVITARFSEDMDALTIDTNTLSVDQGASGAVSYDSNSTAATFTPSADLNYNTTYTVTITTEVEDLSGDPLQADYTFSFTTEPPPDIIPPTIISTSPSDNETGVALDTLFTATFSEAMDGATIDTNTFSVDNGITGTVSYDSNTMTASFTPDADLDYDTTYTATITTGVEDLAWNPLQADYIWSFTTGPAPDTTPPTINSTNPLNGATGVFVNSTISATFSEAVDATTITSSSFTVNDGAGNIPGNIAYNGVIAAFSPSSDLDYDTTYTATITTDVEDLSGNPVQTDYTWAFTTGPAPDTTPPTINSNTPLNDATDVPVDATISVTFSEDMDASTIDTNSFTLNNGVTGTISYDSNRTAATFTPSADLNYNTTYTVTITTGVEDLSGNPLQSDYTFSFTTEPPPDIAPPTIIGTLDSGIWYWDVVASEWTQMAASTPTGDIAAGDFTGDGKADVASCWGSGLWYQDWATLNWIKVSGSAPNSLTAADVTGDGQAEIIGTWSSGVWYWDVAAAEWTKMTSQTTTGDIAAGDFTGDGKADVASIWASGLWYQDGDTLAWTKVGSPPSSVTAGDVTGDGRLEIIGTWSGGIWYWDVAASKWTKMTSQTTTGDIAAGDFTGDGKADVASCWDSGLWYQDGVTLAWTKVSSTAPVSLTAGDVTED